MLAKSLQANGKLYYIIHCKQIQVLECFDNFVEGITVQLIGKALAQPDPGIYPEHYIVIEKRLYRQVYQHTIGVPTLGRLRQKHYTFQASLGYMVRRCKKKKKLMNKKTFVTGRRSIIVLFLNWKLILDRFLL